MDVAIYEDGLYNYAKVTKVLGNKQQIFEKFLKI